MISAATPDADSAWPILALTDPRNMVERLSGPAKAFRMLSHSIGSPTGVPVPSMKGISTSKIMESKIEKDIYRASDFLGISLPIRY